jgi:hypothetical protein
MIHIQIKILINSGLPASQFPQPILEGFMICPFYHDEYKDLRKEELAKSYLPIFNQ